MKYIPLTQGKFAIVDDSKYDYLNQFKWYAHIAKGCDTYYAYRKRCGEIIAMHRDILGLRYGDKMQVDHKNHNGLDNRIENIRACNHRQNQMNRKNKYSSKHVCVHWLKDQQKWRTQIRHKGEIVYVGVYKTEEEAAKARDNKAYELLGEYAYRDFR